MIQMATDFYLKLNEGYIINAYIKEKNLNSKYAFEKAGFILKDMVVYNGYPSYHYIKTK